MAGSRELTVRILGDAAGARRALNEVDDATTQSESRWKKYGGAIAAAGAVAGVALVKFGADSVAAFNESRKVTAQTEAVIKSTGGAANVTADQIGGLADKLQKLSGVSGESIQEGQNLLLTFTGIRNEAGKGNDVFDQATRTLLDMSVALGTDAKSSAVQLGKALNDPIAGISALSRVGVTFTAEQKATIQSMVDMGDKAGAQKVILAELNREFGGSAKAAGEAQSPMERLSLQFGDLQEKVGAKLVPVLDKLTDGLLGVIGFVENLDPAVLGAIAVVGAFAGTIVLITKASAAWTAVQLALNAAFWANPLVLVAAAVAALVAGIVIAYQRSETFRKIVDGAFRAVAGAAEFMKDKILGAFRFVVDKFLGLVEMIVKGGAAAFGWVPGIGPKLKDAAKDVEKFRDDVGESLGGAKESGKSTTEQFDLLAGSTKRQKEATEEATESTEANTEAEKRRADALNDVLAATENLIGSQLSVADSLDRLRDGQIDSIAKEKALADAIREHGRTSAEAAKAGEELEDARRDELRDIETLVKARRDLAVQQSEAAGQTVSDADKYRIYRDELIKIKDTLAPGSPLRVHLEQLINQLPPPEVKFAVVADTEAAKAKLEELRGIYKTIAAGPTILGAQPRIRVPGDPDGPGPAAPPSISLPPKRRARGGSLTGLGLVGEEGPELINVGSTPHYVTDADKTAAILAASSSPAPSITIAEGAVQINLAGPADNFDTARIAAAVRSALASAAWSR